MASVGDLSVKITADIADFSNALSQAASAASSAGSDISSSLQGALSGLTDSINALGGQFDTLSQHFQNTASAAQTSGDQVQSTGEKLQSTGASANEASGEFGNFGDAVKEAGDALSGIVEGPAANLIEALTSITGGVVAAGIAIAGLSVATGEWAERNANLAASIGTSVENLKLFQEAAALTGVSVDNLGGFAQQLERKLSAAGNAGLRFREQLAQFGVVPADFNDLNIVLLKIGEAIIKMGGDTPQARAELAALARGGAQMEPLLQNLGEAEQRAKDLTAAFSSGQASSGQLAGQLNQLGIVAGAAGHALGELFAPPLIALIEGVTVAILAFGAAFEIINAAISGTARVIIDVLVGAFATLVDSARLAGIVLFDVFTGRWGAITTDAETALRRIGTDVEHSSTKMGSDWKAALIRMGVDTEAAAKSIGAALSSAIETPKAKPGPPAKPGPDPGEAKRLAQEALAAELAAAQGEAKINEDRLANTKAFYEEQFALGQTSREQETAQLLSVESQNYQIQHNALEQELADLRASGAAKPAQIQKVNDQIEELDIASAGRRQAIQAKADEAKYTDLVKTNAIVISEQQSAGDAQVALEEAQTQRQLDLGQITAKQAIQQNIDEEDQKYNVQQNAFEQELAALDANQSTTQSQYEAFYAKVEAAQQAHEQRTYNLQTKAEQAQQADLNTFLGSVESAYNTVFDTVFNDIGKGWKKLSKDLLGDLEKIGEEILKSGIRDILFGTQGQTGPLAGLVNMLGVGPQGLLGKLFGPLFGVSGAAATGVVGSGTNAVAPAMNIVATKVADMGEAVGHAVTGAGSAAAGAISHAGTVAGNAFIAAGTTVSKGLSDSIGAGAKAVAGPATGACCNALDGAASSIKDGSAKIGKAAEPLSTAGHSLGGSANALNRTVDDFSDPIHTLKTGSAALEHTAQDITGVMPAFKAGSAAMGNAANSLSKFSEIIPPLRDATGNLRDTASKLASTASDLGSLGGGGLPAPTVSTVGGIPVSVGTTGAGFGPIGMPFMPAIPGMIPPGPKPPVEPGALPSGAVGAAAGPITNINNIISTLTGPVTTLLTNAFNATSAVVNHLINTAFVTNAPVVTTIWNQAFLGSLPAIIPLFNSGFGNSVPAIIPLFGSGFNGSQPNVTKLFQNAFDGAQPNITKALQRAIDNSQSTLQKAFQTLLPVFAQAAELFGVISCALLTECCSCGGGGGGQGGMGGGGGGGGGSGGQPSLFPSIGGAIGLAGLLGGLGGGGGGVGGLGAFDAAGQGQFPTPLGSLGQYTGAQGTGLLGSEGGGLGSQFGSLATGGLGIAAALGPLIGGAIGGPTGSAIGGGLGGATLLGLGALTGNPLLAIGGGIELLTSLLGIGGGRPTAEATQDIGRFANSSVPSLRQLGKGAQALSAAGIPVSSPQAGPIFGPYFNNARILEDVIRWGPGGLSDTHAQDLDALTLKNAMTEMGNPGHGTATINAIAQAWNNYQAAGGTNAQLTRLTGISGFEHGGISPMGGLALLHPNEMVLPSNIADAIKKMTIAPPAAPLAHADNRNPRAYHVHFNINAIDSRGVESWINENQHLIADAVFNSSRQFRNLGIEP